MKSVTFVNLVSFVLVAGMASAAAGAAPRETAAAGMTAQPAARVEEKLLTPDGLPYDGFGHSIALDGDFALLAAPNNPSNNGTGEGFGGVYVWHRVGGVWQYEQKLLAADRATGDAFGASVVLQGTTAVIAAPYVVVGGHQQAGAAYVFDYDGTQWVQTQKLTSDAPALIETFGDSVAIDGTTIVVGASGNRGPNGEPSVGAAYVFEKSAGTWALARKLVGNPRAARDLFGISVAVSGDVILVGASQATWTDAGPGLGRVHVFERGTGDWAETGVLHASDGVEGDYFGAALAFDGNRALIGAPAASIEGRSYQGAAYVYEHSGSDWVEQTKLSAAEGGEMGVFGRAVALRGDRALIGAPGDLGFAGAAYLFSLTSGAWAETAQLAASDGVVGDYLGWAVAVGPDAAFVGAPHELNDGLNSPGAVYLYSETPDDTIFADGFDSAAR